MVGGSIWPSLPPARPLSAAAVMVGVGSSWPEITAAPQRIKRPSRGEGGAEEQDRGWFPSKLEAGRCLSILTLACLGPSLSQHGAGFLHLIWAGRNLGWCQKEDRGPRDSPLPPRLSLSPGQSSACFLFCTEELGGAHLLTGLCQSHESTAPGVDHTMYGPEQRCHCTPLTSWGNRLRN